MKVSAPRKVISITLHRHSNNIVTIATLVPKGLTPSERFMGGPNNPSSGGMGLVWLLRRLILCSVKVHPLLLSLFGSYFTLFPIHTTPQQVEAFHLIVLEHCCSVIDKVMEEGVGQLQSLIVWEFVLCCWGR